MNKTNEMDKEKEGTLKTINYKEKISYKQNKSEKVKIKTDVRKLENLFGIS